jgi:hypothetical protein
VIAGDGDGVPAGEVLGGPGEGVGDQAHGVRDGEDVGAAGDVLLEDVVLEGAGERGGVGAGAFGRGDVEGEQDRRGRVNRHRGGDAVEWDIGEEALHVLERVDGDADAADLAEREGRVRVVADLGGEVEGHREAGGPVGEQEFVTAVGLFRVAHAGVLAHGPEAVAVHAGLDAAGEGEVAGESVLFKLAAAEVLGGVDGIDEDA